MSSKFFLYPYQEGEIVLMKKPHPCGSARWKVLRVGADIKLHCSGCGHLITLTRARLEKMTKAVEMPQTQEEEKDGSR